MGWCQPENKNLFAKTRDKYGTLQESISISRSDREKKRKVAPFAFTLMFRANCGYVTILWVRHAMESAG
jgi:hypothetical protein